MNKPYVIGVCGGSASGKTTFLKKLLEALPAGKVAVLSVDNYYLDRERQPKDANLVPNFDTPESIDAAALTHDLQALLAGRQVCRQEYTFNNPLKPSSTVTCLPATVVIVEGIFVFHYTELARNFDFKIFIDTSEHMRFYRRILRDQEERGYSLDDILYHYTLHTVPSYKRFIEPYKNLADIIVPNDVDSSRAIQLLASSIKTWKGFIEDLA